MTKTDFPNSSLSGHSSASGVNDSDQKISDSSDPGRLLKQRLELVEDLWQTVLRSECPPAQTDRLLRLKQLSDPSILKESEPTNLAADIAQLIREMDLAEAISAARAFSLYFQLVNILEQQIEEDSYLDTISAGKNTQDRNDSDPFAPPLALSLIHI